MKKLVFLAVAFASVSVFATEYRTEKVCNRGESGTECVMVTYAVRAPKAVAAPYVACSAEGNPCPPKKSGIPAWLFNLNKAAGDAGYRAAPDVDYDHGP